MMKKMMGCCCNSDTGLLLLRLALGIIFISHGWMKIAVMSDTVSFFSNLGLPAIVAYLVAGIELLGGISILLGLCVKTAGWLLAAVMLGAIIYVKSDMNLVGGYELDLILLASALAVALIGPGKFALQKSSCTACKAKGEENGGHGHNYSE